MKKSYFFFLPLLIAAYVLLSGYGGGPDTDYPGGAPAGYTGSPGDGQNCKNCHGGTATTVAGMITSNIPAAGYTPGASYTITVTVTGSNSKGFEVSPQNASGTLLGTLTAGTGNKLVGSGKYVTQSSASNASTAIWSFGWTAPAAGTGTVTFYGAFTASKPVTKLSTLVVNENAPLTATATATPSSILSGQSSQLNVSATGGGGTYTYSWSSNPAGFTSTIQNPVVSPTSTTQYSVQVSDGSTNTNSSVTVTVTTPPPLTVTASANPATINPGMSSQLNAAVTGGSGSYTYSWTSNPAGFTSTLQNPSVTPSATTTYSVSVNDGSSTQNSSTTVTVNASPLTANASAAPSTVCAGQTTQLDVTAAGGSGSYTYAWTSVPAGFTSNLQNPVASPTANTTYTVVVSDGIGSANATAGVTVVQAATADAGIDTVYCTTISSFPNYGTATNYSAVLWSTSGDGTFNNASELTSTYIPGSGDKAAGFVNLYLTASPLSPCSANGQDGRHIVFDPCNGIPAGAGNPVLTVYPNPSNGVIWVEASGLNGEEVSLQLVDAHGIRVLSEQLPSTFTVKESVQLSGLPKGIYLVQLINGQKYKSIKIVLE